MSARWKLLRYRHPHDSLDKKKKNLHLKTVTTANNYFHRPEMAK
jgi:hypothetical protein